MLLEWALQGPQELFRMIPGTFLLPGVSRASFAISRPSPVGLSSEWVNSMPRKSRNVDPGTTLNAALKASPRLPLLLLCL